MKQKFTLVELLVVTSILSILISILLPAIEKSRISVPSAVCMSNLQQLATWGISYATDHDRVLPTDGIPSRNNYKEISNTSWYAKNPSYQKRVGSGTPLHCPQATLSMTPRWDWNARNDFDYGLNMYFGWS